MRLPYVVIAPLLLRAATAATCTTNLALQIAESLSAIASPACSAYLGSKHTNVAGLPKTLTSYVFNTASASSVCSCLLARTTSPATCPAASTQTITATSTVTTTQAGAGSTQTVTSTSTVTTGGSTVTSTSTVTTGGSTITSTSTVTTGGSTITSTSTVTTGGSTITSTVTSTSTVTTAPNPVAVDQSGCPAVNGDNAEGYIIYCGQGAGPGSFEAATNPGYNIEDCANQCLDNPDGIDCLGVTYTAPSPPYSGLDGHLLPGTCGFYEFVTAPVAQSGVVLGVYENTFARKRRR